MTTLRITVDAGLCSGHGRCYALSPDVFGADDEGYCDRRGLELEVIEELTGAARLAADSCPEGAITVQFADTGVDGAAPSPCEGTVAGYDGRMRQV